MKIIIDDKIPYIQGQAERLADEVVYLPGNSIGPDEVRDADALVIRTRTQCNRQLLEGSKVRFIATATIGYDHLDTEYLHEAGIQWTNCPGCNATSVAQYVRNSLFEAEQQGLVRLKDATLGIIGYGHVGKAVCKALSPHVGSIILNDPPLKDKLGKLEELGKLGELETLQTSCNIITLHTPLTHGGPYPTYHLVDEAFISRLKRGTILINAARGGVVNESALMQALDRGHIGAAIIDTWESEPDINLQLLRKTFIGTPHIAGYSADGKANATRMALEALAHWMGRNEQFDIQPPEGPRNYNPMDDSERLKENPSGFEYQRGHYPIRRE